MIYNHKVGLPIYALTGFFVCIDFFRKVNQNEKRRYSFKASHSGRGGTVYRDGEGCMWRANAVYSYRENTKFAQTP